MNFKKGNKPIVFVLSFVMIGLVGLYFLSNQWQKEKRDSNINQNLKMNALGKWSEYQNKKFGFSFLYPETMFLQEDNYAENIVSISALRPDDPKKASDIGIQSTFFVNSIGKITIAEHIKNMEQGGGFYEHIDITEIIIDGDSNPLVSYTDALGTSFYESFIKVADGNVLKISFVRETEYTNIFLNILKSFKI